MKTSAQKLRRITLAAAAVLSLGSAGLHAAVGLTLSQSTIQNDATGTISLTITGLATGQTVLVEKFADLNANGVVDGTDALVRSFTVTDGVLPTIGGVRNINIPGDNDLATAGRIRVDLDQPGIDGVFGSFSGGYIYRVSDPAHVFASVTQPFTVTQHTYPQGIQGHITRAADATPVAGAFVVLFVGSNGNAVGGTFTDATGFYQLQTLPGNYQVFAIVPGLVTDQSTANVAVVATSFTTHDQALAAGTFTISGQLTDVASTAGIPGIFLNGSSDSNQIVGGFTDASGNYSFSVLPGQWSFDIIESELAQLGYLRLQSKPNTTITSASAIVNIALPKATALIYGTVKDNAAVPVIGVGLNANDQGNLYEGVGVSVAPNGDYAVGVLAGTWFGNVSTDNLPAGYIAGLGSSIDILAGQAIQANVVLTHVTAHLQGTVTNLGVPVTGVEVDGYVSNGGGNTLNVSAITDGSGNFDLGVIAGDWSVVLSNNSASSNNLVGPNLPYTIIDGQTISGIAFHVLSATGSISGTVKDFSANPLSNAGVTGSITIASVVYNAGAQTDGTGSYSFPVVDGTWNVNAYTNGLNFNPRIVIVSGSAVVNFVPTVITFQPQPQTVPTGASAGFSIQTNAPGTPTFQWQVSTNGGSVWNNLSNGALYSGVTTLNLSISAVTNAMTTYRYRCVVTYAGTPGFENSFGAVLTVNPVAPNFTQQPSPQSVGVGQTATFTAQVNDGAATLQWQVSTNGGSTWNNVTDNATYSGSTTGTLTITNPTGALNGHQYRVLATDVVQSISTAVTLNVGSAANDFNGDNQSDLLFQNSVTGERAIWLMNGTTFASGITVGVLPTDWSIAATGDFNGDNQPDLVWQNTATGERAIWLMNGGAFASGLSLGIVPTDWSIAATADFNGDGQTDLLWQNKVTGERSIWLMNGGAFMSGVSLGVYSTDWVFIAAADFNHDGQPDILLENIATGEAAIWLMSGTSVSSSVSVGTVPSPLQLAGAGDYNGDGQPDILWSNPHTGERGVWLMNGAVISVTVSITTIPTDWILDHPVPARASGPSDDFNGDGKSDILWQNTVTGERAIWLMNGGTLSSGISLGVVPGPWTIVGTGDFNGDGMTDIVWQNTATGRRTIWLMNGGAFMSGVTIGTVPTDWSIAAVADFNGDGKPDLVWQNTVTGERAIWLMNGATFVSGITIGVLPTDWSIVGAADFNHDGQPDLVWQNTVTGERAIWLMNNGVFVSGIGLGVYPTDWSIAGTGDFNADGEPDLLWQNTVTGERAIWLMNNGAYASGIGLGIAPTAWSIRN